MKKYHTFALLVLFSFFSLLNCTNFLFAQNETGTRYLNKEMFQMQHIWLDSSTQVFQEGFPIIQSIPPLSTNMPFNVLISYIYLDSLLRFSDRNSTDSVLKSWNSLNDTLKGTLKYMYTINDYNPIFFNQYANEVKFARKRGKSEIKIIGTPSDTSTAIRGRYLLDLYRLKWDICEKFRSIYSNTNKKAYYSMLYADYILRVKIISIDSMINKNSSMNYYRYKVSAKVIDTLKGKVYQTTFPTQMVKANNFPQPTPLFNFQFTPLNYGMLDVDGQEPLYTKPDYGFLRGNAFNMKINQEAIVFISFNDPIFDFQNDYFNIELEPRCSLNALRIEDGNVLDLNNVWSSQPVLPYNDWKQIYINLFNNIMNENY